MSTSEGAEKSCKTTEDFLASTFSNKGNNGQDGRKTAKIPEYDV